MTHSIEITARDVHAALEKLKQRLDNHQPFLHAVGEDQVERIKGRFATATGPDGVAWRQNSPTTLTHYIMSRGGVSKKTGKPTAKGKALGANKRPLQGLTNDLARQIFYQVAGEGVTIGSSMIYAAMQHFGGSKGKFPHLWGDIPARPFLPITAAGELYPAEEARIVQQLREYLIE